MDILPLWTKVCIVKKEDTGNQGCNQYTPNVMLITSFGFLSRIIIIKSLFIISIAYAFQDKQNDDSHRPYSVKISDGPLNAPAFHLRTCTYSIVLSHSLHETSRWHEIRIQQIPNFPDSFSSKWSHFVC